RGAALPGPGPVRPWQHGPEGRGAGRLRRGGGRARHRHQPREHRPRAQGRNRHRDRERVGDFRAAASWAGLGRRRIGKPMTDEEAARSLAAINEFERLADIAAEKMYDADHYAAKDFKDDACSYLYQGIEAA